ncbi:MAG: Hsp70 family protein [Chloroflexaceae bacterium]
MAATFGLDFGTTNSVITIIEKDPMTGHIGPNVLLSDDGRPHPSVVWYHGTEINVGRKAKDQLTELGLGVFGNIVRSPKMFLGSPTGIYVGGVTRQAVDVVADILRFLRQDALSPTRKFEGYSFDSAIITIPVSMRGPARAELRQAAQKAGIHIYQFIHEPLAALYGYLRARPDFYQELANLERRLVLVFDWGGGTLDITLCQFQNGVLSQVLNIGDNQVGGDRFDDRVRQLIRQKHESQHPQADWSRLQPSAEVRLTQECEDARIALSSRSTHSFYMRDLLAASGAEKDLDLEITRLEVEEAVRDLISQGLGKIETILNKADIHRGAIEFCLATGGMVSMPAIQSGLREIFGMNRLRLIENAATVISEGAAWIAYDGIGLQLAKPIELLHADDSYIEIIPAGTDLPLGGKAIHNRIDMYCVDPSDGFAKFLFARPRWPGRQSHGDERLHYAHLTLPVDSHSRPLFERLQVDVTIDHDLIAEVCARSLLRRKERQVPIHDLEFGLSITGVESVKKPSQTKQETRRYHDKS